MRFRWYIWGMASQYIACTISQTARVADCMSVSCTFDVLQRWESRNCCVVLMLAARSVPCCEAIGPLQCYIEVLSDIISAGAPKGTVIHCSSDSVSHVWQPTHAVRTAVYCHVRAGFIPSTLHAQAYNKHYCMCVQVNIFAVRHTCGFHQNRRPPSAYMTVENRVMDMPTYACT